MDEPVSDPEPGKRESPIDTEKLAASVRAAGGRMRRAVTLDRVMACLCLFAVLAMAAPWVRVVVAERVGWDVSYSVPDLLATGRVAIDRAQSLQDLADDVRGVADRAAQIIERAQDAAERASSALDERG